MRVCVVGLGGVGGYIAANFAKSGIDVTGVARGVHLEAIKQKGIEIIEDKEQWNVSMNACSQEELEGIFDVVLFCTKSYDLAKSAKAMRHHITKESVVVSLANGVNNGDILRNVLDTKVVDGAVYILSSIKEPGVIRKKGKVFATVFGGDGSEKLAQLFEQAELRYKISLDIQKDLWKKYIFIAAFANLTSYYNKSIYEVYKEHPDQTKALLEEIASLAKAKGIDIDKEVEKSLQTALSLPKDASTSMHLDFQNKKQTELEALSGYLVEEAKKYGVELPNITKIYRELVKR
ncbi:2-dehydropantoate 2-reductase [hydrothermal vent metagenome]|uniref:2-dehydropantoate 2-reductase n=1 Tax=hydrothermal vent metagenome TaxID=652676 RepID=A0A1W1BCB8_9ZZZZ